MPNALDPMQSTLDDGSVRAFAEPAALRHAVRAGRFRGQTSGQCPGYLQGNLVILPAADADAFLRFCVRNPKPCPIVGVGEPGDPMLPRLGADLDIRTDVPGYRVFRDGEPADRVTDICALWRDDLVTFVLGCSFSFEHALMRSGVRVRHIEAGGNVPMYVTSIETEGAAPFGGPLVVSLRAFRPADAIRAITLSERYPIAHGAPVHIGDAAQIGIADLSRPDFGDPPVIEPGDIPVFWACGVTPQLAIRRAAPAVAITHDPGHMLVTDLIAESPP